MEDEYHVTLVCEQFTDARKKYFKKYFYGRPSMAKFVELMNTKFSGVARGGRGGGGQLPPGAARRGGRQNPAKEFF